jgi:uncharacterized repeat protein (TIGR04138 family)
MPKIDFAEALNQIIAEDPRYTRDAYYFLRDALDFTIKQRRKSKEISGQRTHVTGQQLLEGVRVYAVKQFGPMVTTVFGYWGVRRCEDFGALWSLISSAAASSERPTTTPSTIFATFTTFTTLLWRLICRPFPRAITVFRSISRRKN